MYQTPPTEDQLPRQVDQHTQPERAGHESQQIFDDDDDMENLH